MPGTARAARRARPLPTTCRTDCALPLKGPALRFPAAHCIIPSALHTRVGFATFATPRLDRRRAGSAGARARPFVLARARARARSSRRARPLAPLFMMPSPFYCASCWVLPCTFCSWPCGPRGLNPRVWFGPFALWVATTTAPSKSPRQSATHRGACRPPAYGSSAALPAAPPSQPAPRAAAGPMPSSGRGCSGGPARAAATRQRHSACLISLLPCK
ncbi:MAG: hypothetical protein J3K34DRAFT_434982 [Monoraphidium minutum]|nr:MAG: hypothetical protein J3K34DRAFT_434982 [Monoraphidium minutum]